jgi:hypothetical protein
MTRASSAVLTVVGASLGGGALALLVAGTATYAVGGNDGNTAVQVNKADRRRALTTPPGRGAGARPAPARPTG